MDRKKTIETYSPKIAKKWNFDENIGLESPKTPKNIKLDVVQSVQMSRDNSWNKLNAKEPRAHLGKVCGRDINWDKENDIFESR